MGDVEDQEDENVRFFSPGQKKEDGTGDQTEDVNLDALSLNKVESEEINEGTCLTLRILQTIFTCGKKKGLWEHSQGNVFKSHEVEETKYPFILKVLEFKKLLDCVFIATCLASIFLFFFSVGFLMKSKLLWGIIHMNNAIYTVGLFALWLRILITSKYAKTNQGYTKTDVVLALVTVFPIDLVILVIYNLNNKEVNTPIDSAIIASSRFNYLLRIYYVSRYFCKPRHFNPKRNPRRLLVKFTCILAEWENQLVIGDAIMFIIRTTLYSMFLIHIYACIWHRIACKVLLIWIIGCL